MRRASRGRARAVRSRGRSRPPANVNEDSVDSDAWPSATSHLRLPEQRCVGNDNTTDNSSRGTSKVRWRLTLTAPPWRIHSCWNATMTRIAAACLMLLFGEARAQSSFEWAGVFSLTGMTSPSKWSMQASADGNYPD
eukprot:COSAG02_NODE_39812_length_412_cov_1.316294_1_plen_136_part_11